MYFLPLLPNLFDVVLLLICKRLDFLVFSKQKLKENDRNLGGEVVEMLILNGKASNVGVWSLASVTMMETLAVADRDSPLPESEARTSNSNRSTVSL